MTPPRPLLPHIIACLFATVASAHPSRDRFVVPTPGGQTVVEGFGHCPHPICPAVLVLSGSKGFDAVAYDDLGEVLLLTDAGADTFHGPLPDPVGSLYVDSRGPRSGRGPVWELTSIKRISEADCTLGT